MFRANRRVPLAPDDWGGSHGGSWPLAPCTWFENSLQLDIQWGKNLAGFQSSSAFRSLWSCFSRSGSGSPAPGNAFIQVDVLAIRVPQAGASTLAVT